MKLIEIEKILPLNRWTVDSGLEAEVSSGFSSDLLSHVVGYSKSGQIWLTCQAHRNIIAVASLKDLPAIILVNFKGKPDKDLIETAEQENIVLYTSGENSFDLAGKLFQLLNPENLHAR